MDAAAERGVSNPFGASVSINTLAQLQRDELAAVALLLVNSYADFCRLAGHEKLGPCACRVHPRVKHHCQPL